MLQLLTDTPVPIYHLDTPTDWQSLKLNEPVLQRFWLDSARALNGSPFFRCVSFDRFQSVLKTGVDVAPSHHHIYVCSDYEKALEYGGAQKIMLVYDSELLHKTYREVSFNTPTAELQALADRFSTRLTSADSTTFWFSRLPEDDTALASGYEREYGHWIPGDPFEALKAIILIGQFTKDDLKLIPIVD